jgi:hypothetical protein
MAGSRSTIGPEQKVRNGLIEAFTNELIGREPTLVAFGYTTPNRFTSPFLLSVLWRGSWDQGQTRGNGVRA